MAIEISNELAERVFVFIRKLYHQLFTDDKNPDEFIIHLSESSYLSFIHSKHVDQMAPVIQLNQIKYMGFMVINGGPMSIDIPRVEHTKPVPYATHRIFE